LELFEARAKCGRFADLAIGDTAGLATCATKHPKYTKGPRLSMVEGLAQRVGNIAAKIVPLPCDPWIRWFRLLLPDLIILLAHR
jgi:hypothetical protein